MLKTLPVLNVTTSNTEKTMTTTLMELMEVLTECSEDDTSIVDFVSYLFTSGHIQYR